MLTVDIELLNAELARRFIKAELRMTPAGLALARLDSKEHPLLIDFADGAHTYRRLHGGGRGQPIAKALGLAKYKEPPRIIDATAGIGQDSFVLACLGATVIALERNPLVALLLQDALDRARENPDLATIVQRITLIQSDAGQTLQHIANQHSPIDIIYLDPMFPHRSKTALVKKELRLLRDIVGDDPDADALLPIALAAAPKVVVKRPKTAPFLNAQRPDRQWLGESNRFDIYHSPVKRNTEYLREHRDFSL